MIEVFVVWLVYPETKGPSIEEIAWLFDGPDATNVIILEKDDGVVKVKVTDVAQKV